MELDKFILEYDTAGNKEKFFADHITTKYVNFARKVLESKRIVETASYDESGNFRIDSVIRNYLFVLTMISLYTDVVTSAEKPLQIYDEFTKRGLVIEIIRNIGQREYDEFSGILDMVQDDLIENERSLVSYIDNKLSSIKTIAEEIKNEQGTVDD